MARLILHADDFGLHSAVNEAIFSAAANGTLTSASLMVNGAAVQEALVGLEKFPTFGVGLHLNIVRGKPLSDPGEIPSLVNKRGYFYNSMGTLLIKSALGAIAVRDIYTEYTRQYLFMLEHGVSPTHVDGEKHSHILLPAARKAVQRLLDDFDIRAVRLINETPLFSCLDEEAHSYNVASQRIKCRVLEYCAVIAARLWKKAVWPTFTMGISHSGKICDKEDWHLFLKNLLQQPSDKSIEWMFHPGYDATMTEQSFQERYGSFFLGRARLREEDFLNSPQTISLLEQYKDQLITYGDL